MEEQWRGAASGGPGSVPPVPPAAGLPPIPQQRTPQPYPQQPFPAPPFPQPGHPHQPHGHSQPQAHGQAQGYGQPHARPGRQSPAGPWQPPRQWQPQPHQPQPHQPYPPQPYPPQQWQQPQLAPPPPPPRSSRRAWLVTSIITVVALVCAGAAVHRAVEEDRRPYQASPYQAAPAGPAGPAARSWADAEKALEAASAALLKGDEKGWLALVDPGNGELVKRYKRLYKNLRGLEVSTWSYHAVTQIASSPGPTFTGVKVDVVYCFQGYPCPKWRMLADDVPRMQLVLSMEPGPSGGYVLTDERPAPGVRRNPPWVTDDLIITKGKRVTVVATARNKGRIRTALAQGDRAAVTPDRFGAMVGVRVPGYRVYLADGGEWKRWFYGATSAWMWGYATPNGATVSDVVIQLKHMRSAEDYYSLLRHEFAHVATMAGYLSTDGHEWVAEGLAEFIRYHPRWAEQTGSRDVVRRLRRAPTSLNIAGLTESSSVSESDAFYSVAYMGVSCMIKKFGEAPVVRFMRDVDGTAQLPYEAAAQKAFGRSWASIDAECVAQIKKVRG